MPTNLQREAEEERLGFRWSPYVDLYHDPRAGNLGKQFCRENLSLVENWEISESPKSPALKK
jgi:hypothetical protein